MKALSFSFVVVMFLFVASISAQSSGDKAQNKKSAKTTVNIDGMTCQSCVNSVEKKLGQIDGVTKYDVSLEKNEAVIEYDPKKVNEKKIEEEFKDSPYKVSAKKTKSDKTEK